MKKKGFTLIELLAVIVILAILIVIAVPKILNVIERARENAWNDSVKLIKNAIRINTQVPDPQTGAYKYTISSLCDNETSDDKDVTNKIKDIAKVGDMSIKCKKNEDYIFTLIGINKFDGKEETLTYNSSENISESSSNVGPANTDIGNLVYFDPVSADTCDSTHFDLDAIKAGTSTCYKWRIISKSGNNLTVQMDHNLINQERWSTGSSSSSGPDKALTSLANATVNWTRVPVLNSYTYDTTASNYNYGVMTCTNGICTKADSTLIAGTQDAPVRARLITGEEVKTITVNAGAASDSIAGTWTLGTYNSNYYYFSNSRYTIGTKTQGTNDKALSWLIENTTVISDDEHDSGSTLNAYESKNNSGYWTLSPVKGSSSNAWFVSYAGNIYNYKVDNSYSTNGVRPVITLSKNYFLN